MEIVASQLLNAPLQLRAGVREFVPGGGGFEADLAYAVIITKIAAAEQKQNKPPQFIFTIQSTEPGFLGIERSVYIDLPQSLQNVQGMDSKALKSLEIDHDSMFTTLRSMGYTPESIAQIAGSGSFQYGAVFNQAPGRGNAFVFARTWERKKMDRVTKQAIVNPTTGAAETEERVVLDFTTPEHYAKHSASGRAARANAQGTPSANAPQAPQGYQAPQGGYQGGVPAGNYGAPVAQPQPQQQQYGAPQGYTPAGSGNGYPGVNPGLAPPPGASAIPNGQYGAPQPPNIMASMQVPRA